MPRGQLWHHVNERHIKKDARSGCKHPGGEVVQVAQGQPGQHADEGEDGGENVVEDRLLDCHPSFEQHCKVSCVKR